MKLSPEHHCAALLDGRTLNQMIATDEPAVFQQHRFGPWQPAGDIQAPSRPGESLTVHSTRVIAGIIHGGATSADSLAGA